jgi:hypothetical protein
MVMIRERERERERELSSLCSLQYISSIVDGLIFEPRQSPGEVVCYSSAMLPNVMRPPFRSCDLAGRSAWGASELERPVTLGRRASRPV